MSSIYISDNYVLTTNPAVTCTLTYETKRENNTVFYRFKVEIQPNNTTAFAYNLKLDITLNGHKILSGGALKDIQPSKWNTSFSRYFPHQTGWYQVNNIGNAETLPCAVKFYSTQTSGSASANRVVAVPVLENDVQSTKVKINGVWKNAANVFVKVSGIWKQAEKVYVKNNGIWRSG